MRLPRITTLYITLAILIVLGDLFYFHVLLAAPSSGTVHAVTVTSGESVGEIAKALKEAKLIRSPKAFVLLSFLSGRAHRLMPGLYEFTGTESASHILGVLASGPPEKRVTIPEGSTLKEIDALLLGAGIAGASHLAELSPSDFTEAYPFLKGAVTLEGFLFPDTYAFEAGTPSERIVEKFLDTFQEKVIPSFTEKDITNGTLERTIIIASLIEKEVLTPGDRKLIAGIIEKRLKLGIPLQIDATVIYAKCGAFKDCDLLKSDFALASPMNTYKNAGLPPAPIGNPGVDAIFAALHPQTSPYLYYLSDPKSGKTIFAKTFEEHDENRAKYINF